MGWPVDLSRLSGRWHVLCSVVRRVRRRLVGAADAADRLSVTWPMNGAEHSLVAGDERVFCRGCDGARPTHRRATEASVLVGALGKVPVR